MNTLNINKIIFSVLFFIVTLPLAAMNSQVVYDNPEHTSGSFTLLASDCTQAGWEYYFEVTGLPTNSFVRVDGNFNENIYTKITNEQGYPAVDDWGPGTFFGTVSTNGKLQIYVANDGVGSLGIFSFKFVTGNYSANEDSYLHGNSIVDGSVGIGTYSPTSKLDIVDYTYPTALHIGNMSNDSRYTSYGIYSVVNNPSGHTIGLYSQVQGGNKSIAFAGLFSGGHVGVTGGDLKVYGGGNINLSGAGGKLGIGFDGVPQAPLHIKSSAGYGSFRISPSADNTETSMGFFSDAAGTTIGTAWIVGNSCWGNVGKFSIGNQAAGGPIITAQQNGFVGIGTPTPDALLTVKGTIHAREVLIDINGALVPDFVFGKNYKLMPLSQVERFVKANNHLPEIPSAAEVSRKGMSVGEMQNKLLQKVEELTLYIIEQQKEIDQLKQECKK
jgi:hypothetical protein